MRILFRILKLFVIFILSLVVGIIVLNISPWTGSKVKGDNKFRSTGMPLIIPHGGAKELVPENTVYSYDMLVSKYEVDVLEIDLVLTGDNVIISHHDLDLDMSFSSELNDKFIKDYTYNEIIVAYDEDNYYKARKFVDPDGNKPFENETDVEIMSKMIPAKLEDIFITNGNKILYMLEIKDAPTSEGYEVGSERFELATKTLIDLIKEYNLEDYVVLGSFSDDVTKLFKEIAPDIMVGAAMNEVTKFSIYSAFYIDFFWKTNSEVLILPIPESMSLPAGLAKTLDLIPNIFRKNIAIKHDGTYRTNLANKQIINDAHRKNMAVIYWTVNDAETMKLLIELGADGIITDRPDILIDIIKDLKS